MTALALAPAREPRPRFRHLLAAEWTKLRSLRSTRWTLLLAALVVLALAFDSALADYRNWPRYGADVRAEFLPAWALNDAFGTEAAFVLMLTCGCVGALAVTGEFASGLLRTSVAAVPDRRALMAAKATVLAAALAGYGLLLAVLACWLSQAVLSGRHTGLSLGDPVALRATLAAALLAPISGLAGLGLGAVARHTAAAIVAVVVVLLLVPAFLRDDHYWPALVDHATLLFSWGRISGSGRQHGPGAPYPTTMAGAWIAYAVWSSLAALTAVSSLNRRDL
ncbi:ABC transporter permease [Streptacidiphilus monticola]|uniref:ABC transporter permease n=1 Tax=Streptacidiphilus monticola TaxID=2161674 RepID=A0ABW1G4G7_9ACTN